MQRRHQILVVDDDRDLLRLMSLRLTAAGYLPLVAESGAAALTQLSIERPQLVVTDLRMDGLDGLQLFELIHRRHPALPVIILTAHGSIPDAVSATQQGVFAFLTKPFSSQELLAQIERALNLFGTDRDAAAVSGNDAWHSGILTRNPALQELLSEARLLAAGDASVVISGPSGSGKELLARAIHRASPRHEREFVAVNCAALPESLLEAELFGYRKGAFTGATRDYPGLFQSAHRGTLLLDEIGDMPAVLQVKLLRVLQEKLVKPLGGERPQPADARIISATHRDLQAEVAAGRFREDLFYRLNVAVLELPSLAQRREDIPLLVNDCLERLAAAGGNPPRRLAPEALELLLAAPWPGNVRQLFNVVEQAHALSTTPVIPVALVRRALRAPQSGIQPLEEARRAFEKEYLVRLLKLTEGNVSQAARLAQRNRSDFHKLLRRHGLDRDSFTGEEPG